MDSYIKEIIYAFSITFSMIVCGVCILTMHYNIALFMLMLAAVFILLEFYSLFIRIENTDVIETKKNSHLIEPAGNEFTFQDGYDAVSEPVIRKPEGFKKR